MRNRAGRAFRARRKAIPLSRQGKGDTGLPLIWLSAICAATMVLLLVLSERTLPLLGGDRAYAARLYKAAFMLLIAGVVAGLAPAGARGLARVLSNRAEALAGQDGLFAAWAQFVTRHDIPSQMERAGPVLAALVGIGGAVLAVHIWRTE